MHLGRKARSFELPSSWVFLEQETWSCYVCPCVASAPPVLSLALIWESAKRQISHTQVFVGWLSVFATQETRGWTRFVLVVISSGILFFTFRFNLLIISEATQFLLDVTRLLMTSWEKAEIKPIDSSSHNLLQLLSCYSNRISSSLIPIEFRFPYSNRIYG